jgi:hypothetical protein
VASSGIPFREALRMELAAAGVNLEKLREIASSASITANFCKPVWDAVAVAGSISPFSVQISQVMKVFIDTGNAKVYCFIS